MKLVDHDLNIDQQKSNSLEKSCDIMSAALRPLPGVGVVVEGPRHHKGGCVAAGIRMVLIMIYGRSGRLVVLVVP